MRKTKACKLGAGILAVAVLCGAVVAGNFGQLGKTQVYAAEVGQELYGNGGFDNFFERDYDLTLRNWNTFTSLASSADLGNTTLRDDPACVSRESANHVLKLAHTFEEGKDHRFQNTFYTHFNRPISTISSTGGTFEVSFDLKVNGWDNWDSCPEKESMKKQTTGGSALTNNPYLAIRFEGKLDTHIISPNAEELQTEQRVINEFERCTFHEYTSYPTEGAADGYRRITCTYNIEAKDMGGGAVTMWFTNREVFTALLDNFEFKFNGTTVLSENFEIFDLSIWACADPANTNAWQNWGISSRSEDASYSPAQFVSDGGNYAVRFKKGQGKRLESKTGELVDFHLGGEGGGVFDTAGTYSVSADIKLEGTTANRLSLDITDADDVQTQGLYTNLLSEGKAYYDALPDSDGRSGYKKIEYKFTLTDEQAQLLDAATFTFNTKNGANTLYLDNLSVKAVNVQKPNVVWESTQALDLSTRTNYRFASDVGATEATLSVTYNGKTEAVPDEYVSREGNVIVVDYHLFDFLGYKGDYKFSLANSAGSADVTVAVSGETGLPTAKKSEYVWYKSGDLNVDVDLKGARVLSIENDGITLSSKEWTMSRDNTAIILRENCLNGLISDENKFIVETSDGSFSFTVRVSEEAPPPDEEDPNKKPDETEDSAGGFPGWAIGVTVAASVAVLGGLSVGGALLFKKLKRK